MNAKLVLPLVAAGLAVGAAWSVTLSRKFEERQTDRYKVKIEMTLSGGEATVDATMRQTVKKVYENGEADVETELSDMKIVFMGGPVKTSPEPATVQRVNKQGYPLGVTTGAKKAPGFEVMKLAAILMDRPFVLGQPISVDFADPKDADSKIKGVATLVKVEKDVAHVKSDLDVWSAEAKSVPTKTSFVWTFDVATGKPNTAEGKLTSIPPALDGSLSPSEIKIKLTRIVKK